MEMCKLVREAVNVVRGSLDNHRELMATAFEKADNKMESARTANGVMKAKKQLLIDILENVPLHSGACYFCVVKESIPGENCMTCEYGKKHGMCYPGNEKRSTFDKISSTIEDLMCLIRDTYW